MNAGWRGSCRRRTHRSISRIHCLILLLACLSFSKSAASKATSSPTNFYKRLGVSKTCNEDELKKAYRNQCLKHHPDKGGDEETFKEIQKAYDCLSCPDKRSAYDQFGEAGVNNGGAAAGSNPFSAGSNPFSSGSNPFGGNFQSFPNGMGGNGGIPQDFGSMFGNGFGNGGGMNINLDSILRDMASGNFQQQGFPGFSEGGRGSRRRPRQQPKKSFTRQLSCTLEELYTGTTKKLRVKFGNGKSKTFNVNIKPGWKRGTKIKYPPSSAFPGITFVLEEKPHNEFVRRGNDIMYRYKLKRRREADPLVLKMTLPDGQRIERKLPASFLKKGKSLTIPNRGMPIKGGPERGALIVEFY